MRITIASLQQQLNEAQGFVLQLQAALGQVTRERDALLVEQRPSRHRQVRAITPERIAAHNTYRETLSAARELAIRTSKSVLVTSRG